MSDTFDIDKMWSILQTQELNHAFKTLAHQYPQHFPEERFIIHAALQHIFETLQTCELDATLEGHDRIFDIYMQVFDALVHHRVTLQKIMKTPRHHPKYIYDFYESFTKISKGILEKANIHDFSLSLNDAKATLLSAVKIKSFEHFLKAPLDALSKHSQPRFLSQAGFTCFTIWSFYEWSHDESDDFENTMGFLQYRLQQLMIFESAAATQPTAPKNVYVF